MRGSANVEPDWTLMSPGDYEDIRLLKDTSGQLYGGGPFFGPYGGPQGPAGASGQVTSVTDYLWSKPVYVTSALGRARRFAGLAPERPFTVAAVSVEASNAHSNFFQPNLVAVRAERRLGLCVHRALEFLKVRLS
jgi:hypothetical protein